MKNNFEKILLSLLLGISVMLGLTFWLNTVFGFNLFYKDHWAELSKLQAEHIPISGGFYIAIAIAIFIFVFGMVVIYAPSFKRILKPMPQQTLPTLLPAPEKKVVEKPIEIKPHKEQQNLRVLPSRPPRLNLPTNMTKILEQQRIKNDTIQQKQIEQNQRDKYNSELANIFADAGYTIKSDSMIAGFTPNLFAIAPNEVLWIGAIDPDIEKMQSAVNRLESVFQETLEDIHININAFILDTNNKQYQSDSIKVFKSLDELSKFISENAMAEKPDQDHDQENFDAYSEYIDTIIKYLKSAG